MKRYSIVLLLCAAACASPQAPKAPPPAAVPPTPTPGVLSRIDPNVIEETDTYVIRRLPKSQYTKVDANHIKLPIVAKPIEFFREDDEYYYVSSPKYATDEAILIEEKRRTEINEAMPKEPVQAALPASEFESVSPPVVPARLRLEEVTASGLPDKGMWRASFVVEDVNGDGIPDIIAPPPRLGDGQLHIWVGDGKGRFKSWDLSFVESGKPLSGFSIDYGGVAVGDIDGDGKKDVVSASHSAGLVSLFGDGKGTFRVVRAGLPTQEFSSQAVVLLDANGDGKLDIVASRDQPGEAKGVDRQQVRVYLFLGPQGWEFKKDGILGAFFSNCLSAWDYDGDGRKDVLTGSNQYGALTLLWKNQGDGTFSPVQFPQFEGYAFHYTTAPGTFGPERASSFLDSFYRVLVNPVKIRANGLSLYAFRAGEWTRHLVWRRKEPTGNLFAVATGDLDGDGRDDVLFVDDESRRLRIFYQEPDSTFAGSAEAEEPLLASPGQWAVLVDLNRDGRKDVVLTTTISSSDPTNPGGLRVFLNKPLN